MHKVVDLNDKERNVKTVKKIEHMVPDVVDGGEVAEAYVEVLIVGKNREWTEWWALKDFEKSNPEFNEYD